MFAKNATELASILKRVIGVGTRQTIRNWRRDHPDSCPAPTANGSYRVEEWLEFAVSIGAEQDAGGSLSEKAELENEKLREQIARMRFRRECEQNAWTPNAIIGDEVRRLVAETVSVLRDELETKAPAEHRDRNRAALDKTMARLHRGADDIARKYPHVAVPVIEEEGVVAPVGR